MQNEKNKNTLSTDEIYGSFYVGTMEVAINVKAIQEVVNLPEHIIKMPLAPDFLTGVFNLRGVVIPIINLKTLLHLENANILPTQKIGIIEHEGARVGLLFDTTSEILRINSSHKSDFTYSGENAHNVVSGAIKLDSGSRIVQIIDPFALVSIKNIPQIVSQQKKDHLHKDFRIENRKKCISFVVGGVKMGFEMSSIQEIIKVPEIKPSVMCNDFCIGVVNLRGLTVPIVDFAIYLGSRKPQDAKPNDGRIVVLKLENELFGLLVDTVESINSYLSDDVMTIPLLSDERSKIFLGCISISGVGDVILLNCSEILTGKEISEITQGHSKIYHANLDAQASAKKSGERKTYVSFRLDHLFGVSIKDIREIIHYSNEIVTAPGVPSFVRGVLNLRGQLVTVIETRTLYGMERAPISAEVAKILVFDDGQERFGLIVDSIESIITTDDDKKMKVPELMTRQVQDKFNNDIKEIISCQHLGDKDNVLIILNMDSVSGRIKNSIAA